MRVFISMGLLQVLFPTILNMDNYAYNRQVAKRRAIARSASVTSPFEAPDSCFASLITSPTTDDAVSVASFASLSATAETSFSNNYRLVFFDGPPDTFKIFSAITIYIALHIRFIFGTTFTPYKCLKI